MFVLLLLPIIYQKLEYLTDMKPIIDTFNQLGASILAPVWENARHLAFVMTLFAGVLMLYYLIPNVSLKIRNLIPG
ncbi:hypothetical protein, partial [Clostridium perfringens]|uniref:hypothetical protein n=1 Tax=Clostridium perfringens TaxID=1502 RepID=UPI003754E5C7